MGDAQAMPVDELKAYLQALDFNKSLTVMEEMKSSGAETTELVRDRLGRILVRKTLLRDSGIGKIYGQLKAAQDAGMTPEHLPRIYAYFTDESSLIVVMEHFQGLNLWERLDLEGTGIVAAERYFGKICDAVYELHNSFNPPIIHRDLKPSNILVTADGAVKLLDFGISREFRQGAQADTRFFGTREYAPPEQYGFKQTDVRSDIYSLGMILYHILTGQTPSGLLHDEGFPDKEIPEPLRRVLLQATEFDPDRRFSSVVALKRAFEYRLIQCGRTVPSAKAAPWSASRNSPIILPDSSAMPAPPAPITPPVPARPQVPRILCTSNAPMSSSQKPVIVPATTAPVVSPSSTGSKPAASSPESLKAGLAQAPHLTPLSPIDTPAAPVAEQPEATGAAKWTPVLARDLAALVVLAIGIALVVGSWPGYDSSQDPGYNIGFLASGFVLFLAPAVAAAYWISSKYLLKRLIPRLGTVSEKAHVFIGLALAALSLMIVFIALFGYAFSRGA